MPNIRHVILIRLAIPIALVITACGANPPTITPTLEDTPLPFVTPTLVNTLPPTPLPYTPMVEGAVDVGGYKLLYQCFGQGSPAVIVEAGGGDKPVVSLTWKAVIQPIQTTTRICIYDRVDGVRTSQDIAEDLHVLLSKIPVPGPYILVAHSLGGWHARVFAHLYPDEVAGLILVDTTPTYPDAWITYATAYPTYAPDEASAFTENRLSEAAINTNFPPPLDGLDMRASNDQVRQAGSFGDLPLIVISHTPGAAEMSGIDPVAQEQFGAILLKVQADLATLSSKGLLMVAKTSDHFISVSEPQIVIDAITQMVEEIRNH